MNLNRLNVTLLTATCMLLAGLQPRPAQASPLLLPYVPLIVSVSATPNVLIQMDDSGSMDWEILARPHYTICAYDGWVKDGNNNFPSTKCNTTRETGPGDAMMTGWGKPDGSGNDGIVPELGYIFDFDNEGNCSRYGSWYVAESCETDYTRSGGGDVAELDMDWRIRSSSLNVLYYNPHSLYQPWEGGSTTYTNANWSAARSWPDSNHNDYKDTRNLGSNGGFHYNVWIDDRGYSGTKPNRTDMTIGQNDEVDLWDSYIRVTVTDTAISCDKFTITSAGTYGLDATKSAYTCTNNETGGLSLAEMKQNIANWFQYHRRRVHAANAALGSVLSELNEFRYGLSYINQSSSNQIKIGMQAADDLDYDKQITTILDDTYTSKRASGGTPLRLGLDRVGRYYQKTGSDAPITLSCQKSFGVLFTDGYWNGSTPSAVNGDQDGDNATLRRNSSYTTNVTLADVAYKYYNMDLRPDLPDAVPTDSFDTNNKQHMVTYTINFGAEGLLVDEDGNGWPGSGDVPPGFDWYSGADSSIKTDSYWNSRKADDMWHAAYNGKGTFISAKNPQELVKAFKDALLNIGGRTGGAAAAAANSGSISSSSRIFQAKFDSTDWHGELLAIKVKSDGTLDSTPLWNAATKLTAKSNVYLASNAGGRDVFTWNDVNSTGVPFEYSSLNATQKALMNRNGSGVEDNKGDQRVRYLRGEDTHEASKGGPFRNRTFKLGDIVDSDPVYVGYPPFFYPFGRYQSFLQTHINRTGVIYVGANDGMLHAIRESDGEELFAYVPGKVMHKMSKLSDQDYTHEFYVNASPNYGDVQIGGSDTDWSSVLVGALGQGGQGVFALDITNPDSFNSNDVLWEFTDEDDADLGFTIGQPQIKKMANGKWAAIFGNGVNNTKNDSNPSTTGKGAIYILFIKEGKDGWSASDFKKISVPGGSVNDPNAVFTPAAADVDGDNIVDFIYAGDLKGRMWKFDVSSSNTSNWKLALGGNPLFDAGPSQPITDRPAIAAHPYGRNLGQLVLFGTGKFLEYSDKITDSAPTQSIYAVWDLDKNYATKQNLSGSALYHSKSDLAKNTLVENSGVRVLGTGSGTNWLDTNGKPDKKGWYVDFPTEGERMVRKPLLRDNLVFFVSMIPNADPCAAGGTGWIQVLDILTGQPPTFPVFDIDGDQDITDVSDLIKAGDLNDPSDDLVPAGVFSPSIPNLPAMIYDDRPGFSFGTTPFPLEPNQARGCDAGSARAYSFTTGSNGSIMAVATATESLSCGRQSWRRER